MKIRPEIAGDLRRAAALVKHHIHSNVEGINAILKESLDVHRATGLIGGVLATFDVIVPLFVTDAGQRAMAEMILTLAEDSDTAPDEWRRAARFLVAHGLCDAEKMDAIAREKDDVAPMIVALLDVYRVTMPTLHTESGIDILDRAIRSFSTAEVPEAS